MTPKELAQWYYSFQDDLKEANITWFKCWPIEASDPGYREAPSKTVRSLTNGEWDLATLPKCDCGGATDGLHYGWCSTLKDDNG